MMKPFFFVCVFLAGSAVAEWTVLKNCKLVDNPYNDADSFLVESATAYRGKTTHRFRLYFVDTAEADCNSTFKLDRLTAQALYWGADDPAFALRMGVRANELVQRLLQSEFSVYTRGEQAPSLGMPRYYALVRLRDRWLSEILVDNGLARIYGKGTDLPDGRAQRTHWRELRRIEQNAKNMALNGWSCLRKKK